MTRKTEDRINELKLLRSGSSEAADPPLTRALGDKSNLVVAEAAKIIGELQRSNLIHDLLVNFGRLFEDPVKSDPKCWGKTAIIKALIALDHDESGPFLRAATHVQMEPVYGGQEDSAIHLRANAVLALVQCTDLTRSEILRHVVDALVDPSDTVRIEAIRTLEQMNGEEAAVLLRLKSHLGDKRSSVVGQVFDSLLALERERGIEFVSRFMKSNFLSAFQQRPLRAAGWASPGVRLCRDDLHLTPATRRPSLRRVARSLPPCRRRRLRHATAA